MWPECWALRLAWLLCYASMAAGAEQAAPPKLEAAREWLPQLVPLAVKDGRLVLASVPLAEGEAGDPVRKLMALAVGAAGGRFTGTTREGQDETYEAEAACGLISSAADGDAYTFQIAEKAGEKRKLAVRWSKAAGLSVLLVRPTRESHVSLTQSATGPARLLVSLGDVLLVKDAVDFDGLLKAVPDKLQIHLLRPLADFGIALPPSRYLPTVMAAATSGFGAATSEHARKADELIAKLASEKPEERDAASAELARHFPFAVRYISAAAAKADAPETKARMEKVIAAHPNIAKVTPWVQDQKLHEDRGYLLDLLAHAPLFKAAARQRLAELYGKDHGDDPAAWPKVP